MHAYADFLWYRAGADWRGLRRARWFEYYLLSGRVDDYSWHV